MVLFALTLLLLALLVLITLSSGMRLREKMELQAVADASAFSNATVTARTFNELALMNRAGVGHMVAMAGAQSLISWAGFYRASVEATNQAYGDASLLYEGLAATCCLAGATCAAFCSCAQQAVQDISQTRQTILQYQQRMVQQWNPLDDQAGAQVLSIQGIASGLQSIQSARLDDVLDRYLKGQKLTQKIVDAAKQGDPWPDEWKVPTSASAVTEKEIEDAINRSATYSMHHKYASMGSRGWMFTTNRNAAGPLIAQQVMTQVPIPAPDVITVTDDGSAYWAKELNHSQLPVSGEFSWADDHGDVTVFFNRAIPPCTPSVGSKGADAHVKSTDRVDTTDEHVWSPDDGLMPEDKPAMQRHTLGVCSPVKDCPGMWPYFLDYNQDNLRTNSSATHNNNNDGQPKNFALIQRDYSARGQGDPWNLNFKFSFTPSSSSEFDNRVLGVQTAISAGIAYYHRMNHWKEPPNLLNPYWRATLVPLDIDITGQADAEQTLRQSGAGQDADVYKELYNAGFKGGP